MKGSLEKRKEWISAEERKESEKPLLNNAHHNPAEPGFSATVPS